jgi:hypothetical protein
MFNPIEATIHTVYTMRKGDQSFFGPRQAPLDVRQILKDPIQFGIAAAQLTQDKAVRFVSHRGLLAAKLGHFR